MSRAQEITYIQQKKNFDVESKYITANIHILIYTNLIASNRDIYT